MILSAANVKPSLPMRHLPSDTVECYNLKKNEWSLVKNMYEPHYGHAGTVHGDLMYISGELTTDRQPAFCCEEPSRLTVRKVTDRMHVDYIHSALDGSRL